MDRREHLGDVLALPREPLVCALEHGQGTLGCTREPVCFRDGRKAVGFRRGVPSDGVVGEGGKIHAETASASIIGSDDARGVRSLFSHRACEAGSP